MAASFNLEGAVAGKGRKQLVYEDVGPHYYGLPGYL